MGNGVGELGGSTDQRLQFPLYFSDDGWRWIKEKPGQRDQFKNLSWETAARPVGGVWRHRSVHRGINVSSRFSDTVLSLAHPQYTRDCSSCLPPPLHTHQLRGSLLRTLAPYQVTGNTGGQE